MIGALALGPAAVADVNLSPAEADQGSAASLTLQVGNDRPGVFTTKVEVQFPQDSPIAEIYAMSVNDWAPVATSREIDEPLQGVHHSVVSVVTSAITWTRAEDAPKPPGVENLRLELGPLPTSDSLTLTVLQTYSDGTVERWEGPSVTGNGTVLKLKPVAAVEAAPEDETAAVEPEDSNTGVELGLIGAGIVAGVLISALGVVTIGNRNRNRSARPAEDMSTGEARNTGLAGAPDSEPSTGELGKQTELNLDKQTELDQAKARIQA